MARDAEQMRLDSLMHAIDTHRLPVSRDEADLFRLAAQLLRTRYPAQAAQLDGAARAYFDASMLTQRSFPQVVADGVVVDVSRFRHALEMACERKMARRSSSPP